MSNLRGKIAVVGIGETEYVRRSDRWAKALIIEAVQKALDDAKITPQEVDYEKDKLRRGNSWSRHFLGGLVYEKENR